MLIPFFLRHWTVKNLLAALAFVVTCVLAGNAIVVFAQDGGNIADTISKSLSGSLMKQIAQSEEEEVIPEADEGPDPEVPTNGKVIRISLRNQMAYLLEYGIVVKSYRISTGAAVTPTPRGKFEIHKKQPLRVSSLGTPYRMPNYMAFTPNEGFGLHALPYLGRSAESSAYWREARSHIGIPVSHGCIRFLPEEAVEVYEWVDVGTKVFIRS